MGNSLIEHGGVVARPESDGIDPAESDRIEPAESGGNEPSVHVAYIVNRYPFVSHTFIRREIQALERLGMVVERISVRGVKGFASDEDRREAERTRYIVGRGWSRLLLALIVAFVTRPAQMAAATSLAFRLGWGSDRSPLVFGAYLAEACIAARWAEQAGTEHLHAHFGTNSTDVAALTSVLTGLPYSFTVHGPLEFDRPGSIALAEKVRRATFVVAISSFGRSQLYRWADHEDWGKIHVVRCGIDAEFRDSAVSLPPDNRMFTCVGRFSEQKGQLLLVEAIAEVRRRGVDCELTLIGDGEMRPSIEQLVSRLGLQQHVTLAGWMSGAQVREALLRSRALLLPSFAEGLPVVLMEAMSLGRPVLTTYVAGIPELVVHGESGWLFPAGDVGVIADAIESCLAVPYRRLAEMGASARASVVNRHDIDSQAGQLKALIEESVGRRGGRVPARVR